MDDMLYHHSGQMKTYWLMGKTGRVSAAGRLSALPVEYSPTSSTSPASISGGAVNRGYSPVTMDDVVMKKGVKCGGHVSSAMGTPISSPIGRYITNKETFYIVS